MPNYIDKAKIRQFYEAMHDDQLLNFAETDGLSLTSDAFLILREVLQKRNIGAEIIAKLEHEIILRHSLNFRRMEEDFNNELLIKAYRLAFDLKEQRKSDYEIHNALQGIGIDAHYAYRITKGLEDKLLQLIDTASADLITGLVLGTIGVALVYISIQMDHFILGALLFLIFGLIRAIVSANRKKRYQDILTIIKNEIRSNG